MKIQPYDLSRLEKVCIHEAGHYIVSRELKFKTDGITVTIHHRKGHIGESFFEPWKPLIKNLEGLRLYLEHRIQILYAGVIAESMDVNGVYDSENAHKEWEEGGGRIDFVKATELIHTLRNIKHPDTIDESTAQEELTSIDNELINASGSIILDRIKLTYEIGNKLKSKVEEYSKEYTLSEDEINEITSVKDLYGDN